LGPRMRIVDDDVSWKSISIEHEKVEEEEEEEGDLPVVAEFIDERPEEVKRMEEFRTSNKWKLLGRQDEDSQSSDLSLAAKSKMKCSPNRSPPRRGGRHDSPDLSPPRRGCWHDSPDLSPPRGSGQHDSPDPSPPRRGLRRGSPDPSPPRRGGRCSSPDPSPPRRGGRRGSPDPSPPRRGGRRGSPDPSPPRRGGRRGSPDPSPPRRGGRRGSPDPSPPRRGGRRGSPDPSPPRRGGRRGSPDPSPPRRGGRRGSPDPSPPRRGGRRGSPDPSPPRRGGRRGSPDPSPPRRGGRRGSPDLSPPRRRGRRGSPDLSPPRRGSRGTAGLLSADLLRREQQELRRRDGGHKHLEDESQNAETVFRDKSGRKRDLKQEREYLAQGRQQQQNVEDAMQEMHKPLARYIDDQDLDQMLREQEREGDPMANFIKKKKAKESSKDKREKPRYNGPAPPLNRFNIWPGYRWDGVDRSNGFEQQRFARLASKKAVQELAYKWSVEDM
uniref:BUD13 homolog n=1 Tax=Sphenodon punctatus TaxID=8508 RepID=A0A8D0GKQ2_SPHPU